MMEEEAELPPEPRSPATRMKSDLTTLQGASDRPDKKRPEADAGLVEEDGEAAEMLDLEAFGRWLVCMCVVTFDVELGQSLEYIYPPTTLTPEEKSSICYLSFPDSNSGNEGDTAFCFRMRGIPAGIAGRLAHGGKDRSEVEAVGLNVGEQPFLYGFVQFRQMKDSALRRGYFQKSLVLLSVQPFIGVYGKLVRLLAPEFFENGRPMLEATCQNISQWPAPTLGTTLELPILGHVLVVRIPNTSEKDEVWQEAPLQPMMPSQNRITASLNEVKVYECFQGFLSDLPFLWEFVLTGQPLLLWSPYVDLVAESVLSLVSLISPVKYCGDFRPFFTIHDAQFPEYTSKTRLAPPSAILGVTNPYFSKALQHWPVIVRVGVENAPDRQGDAAPAPGRSRGPKWKQGLEAKSTRPLLDPSPFKALLKRLNFKDDADDNIDQNNKAIRRFFVEQTDTFMAPLERYFASLMPFNKNLISPFKSPPKAKKFDETAFLETIRKQSGPSAVALKGDLLALYRKFLQSGNFEGWLRAKQQSANRRLRRIYLEKLCLADLQPFLDGKHEVEVVDLLVRIREELTSESSRSLLSGEMKQQLETHIDTIIKSLPQDLQDSLVM